MNPRSKGVFLVGLLAAAAAVGWANGGPADAFEQNRKLGRGVNILGYDPIWEDRSTSPGSRTAISR